MSINETLINDSVTILVVVLPILIIVSLISKLTRMF